MHRNNSTWIEFGHVCPAENDISERWNIGRRMIVTSERSLTHKGPNKEGGEGETPL